jgi:hypothetical protein
MKDLAAGFKGWNKPLTVDLGTCSFRVTEFQTEARVTRF